MRKKPISSAKPAIDRMMARLQDAKTLRYSWNEAYWREAADYLEETAALIRLHLEPPVRLVTEPEPTEIPDFTRTK